MAKWHNRSLVYKLTLCLLYFIFLVFTLAFSLPSWWGLEGTGTVNPYFKGLWVLCRTPDTSVDFSECQTTAFGDDTAWMDGVRGVWVGGMFFYLLAVVYSFVENCCGYEDSIDYGLTSILSLLAGLCGAAGVIAVAIEVEDLKKDNTNYYWGYMLACIASGLTIILSIILLITRNVRSSEKSRDDRTADYVIAHKQPNPYVSEYTNQGYNRDDMPLANGVTYHHTPTAHPYTMYQDGHNGQFPQPRGQGDIQGQQAKSPYGYYSGRPHPGQHPSESGTAFTDLSNGFTSDLINAEHTLGRSNLGHRGDIPRAGAGDYGKQDFAGRNDYYLNGSRPY